jgi:hypothetical protein
MFLIASARCGSSEIGPITVEEECNSEELAIPLALLEISVADLEGNELGNCWEDWEPFWEQYPSSWLNRIMVKGSFGSLTTGYFSRLL